MANLAIIPARGGSKRIPRKNVKDFFGRAVISYSIEVAIQSGLFDEVMVSTDDVEIAEVAEKFGAKIPFIRSDLNSGDFATTLDVIKEVLAFYREKQLKSFDAVCCIYPAAPLIQIRHLQSGLAKLQVQQLDSVFPVVEFDYPVWRGLEMDEEGKPKLIWEEFRDSRSQDLRKVYHDAGQWYWLRPDRISDSIFTANSGALVLLEEEAHDIDTMSDWKMAELKYNLLHEA